VVEGVRLAEEVFRADWEVQLLLFTDELSERGKLVVDGYAERGIPIEETIPHVLHTISDTQTPQGIMLVVSRRELPFPDVLRFAFIPDMVRDPGNLGTMLRTSRAAGVQVVLIPPETVDPYSPKVIRAGMGAHFHLPICVLSWKEIESYLLLLQVFLADANHGIPYTAVDFHDPLALIVGGEAEGVSSKSKGLASIHLHIPMPGGGESLNAGVAAGVLLMEVARQRSIKNFDQKVAI